MQSLADYQYYSPAISNAAGTGQWSESDPFVGVQTTHYWTSTTLTSFPTSAWAVAFANGGMTTTDKTSQLNVWPVRGGL